MGLISFPQEQDTLLKVQKVRSPLSEIEKVQEVEKHPTEKVSI
jgi:hypothetical protein